MLYVILILSIDVMNVTRARPCFLSDVKFTFVFLGRSAFFLSFLPSLQQHIFTTLFFFVVAVCKSSALSLPEHLRHTPMEKENFLVLFEASQENFLHEKEKQEEEKKNFCDVSVIAKEKSFLWSGFVHGRRRENVHGQGKWKSFGAALHVYNFKIVWPSEYHVSCPFECFCMCSNIFSILK